MPDADHDRARIRAAFPRLAGAGDDILSLADYLDRRPERYYTHAAAEAMSDLLAGVRRDHPDLIIRFFLSYHEALKTAFRSMEDINRLSLQDETLGDIGTDELGRLSALDLVIHPAYLRLTEAVLGVAILPAAQLERRKRAKDELNIGAQARFDELANGPFAPCLEPFQRNIRNAIAHGSLIFHEDGVEYRDFKETVTHDVASAFRLFDRAVDVCNGFLLAYRLFFIEAAEFLASADVTIPLPVLIRELQAQIETPSWRILGALETRYADDKPGLRLLVDSSLEDDREVYATTGMTGAVAERLAPGFDMYDIQLQAFGMPKGVGVAMGATLRDLRRRGIRAPMKVADAFERILVFPRITEQRADLVPDTFIAGQPLLRRTRLVRKADWLQLDATIVLDMDDMDAAKAYLRAHARDLIATAIKESRTAADEPDLRSLPIGAVYMTIFLRDMRQRGLGGIGTNTLCRIIDRPVGPIADWPLYKSIIEMQGRMRIEWNTAPFGDD
jgi:hypothetical protein